MVSKINSLGIFGMESFAVELEAVISNALPAFDVVGLPDTAVKEARDRVRCAIKTCGYIFPSARLTVNLAPADIKKEGPVYDLPLLLSILKASGQLDVNTSNCAFVGELSLSGELRPINGVLSMCIKAKELGYSTVYLPYQNAQEGALVKGIDIIPVKDVNSLINHLKGCKKISPTVSNPEKKSFENVNNLDFSQVKGQDEAKRAIEIAAAGGHNILLIGPPGSGKSMLAKRIPSILPNMTFEEMIETTKIYSIAGALKDKNSLISVRPFRAPHHTVSTAGLSGGGSIPHPGELSLAHNGVLFLDELPEFKRETLEILRQPLEDNSVTISRVNASLTYPCSVMLVAAMNPCPCGYFGHENHPCSCSKKSIARYLSKVSGPLLDRLDIHIEVPAVNFEQLNSKKQEESSEAIKQRVNKAREIQNKRFINANVTCNAHMTPANLDEFCQKTKEATNILETVFDKMGLSARAYDRILKVARTIADLDGCELIDSFHISEAVQYRTLDRKYWNAD